MCEPVDHQGDGAAAFGETLPHRLNGKLVVITMDFCS